MTDQYSTVTAGSSGQMPNTDPGVDTTSIPVGASGYFCGNCFYGRQYTTGGSTVLQCRRNAPQTSLSTGAAAAWAVVQPGDWCGEYRSGT